MKNLVLCLFLISLHFSCKENSTNSNNSSFNVTVQPEICVPGDTVNLIFSDTTQEFLRMDVDNYTVGKFKLSNGFKIVVPNEARNGDLHLTFERNIYNFKNAIHVIKVDSVKSPIIENSDTLIYVYGIGFQYMTEPTIKLGDRFQPIINKTNDLIKLKRIFFGHANYDTLKINYKNIFITFGIKIPLQINKTSELTIEFGNFKMIQSNYEVYQTFEGGKTSSSSRRFIDTFGVYQKQVLTDSKLIENSIKFTKLKDYFNIYQATISFLNEGMNVSGAFNNMLKYEEYSDWNFSFSSLPYIETEESITCFVQGTQLSPFLKGLNYNYHYDYQYGSHQSNKYNRSSIGYILNDNSYLKITLK